MRRFGELEAAGDGARILAEQDGLLVVRYIIDYKKTRYTKDEYPSIRDFYKKMYEMLNEQIVLKKS